MYIGVFFQAKGTFGRRIYLAFPKGDVFIRESLIPVFCELTLRCFSENKGNHLSVRTASSVDVKSYFINYAYLIYEKSEI